MRVSYNSGFCYSKPCQLVIDVVRSVRVMVCTIANCSCGSGSFPSYTMSNKEY